MQNLVVPAIKSHMGSVDYYIISLKAAELVRIVTIPKDTEIWDDLSLEERYQRDINLNRVKKQLAPYFANKDLRFSGSVIIAPISLEGNKISKNFKPIGNIMKENNSSDYKDVIENIGVLNIPLGTTFIPLDGQHRVKAIKFAITGKDDNNEDIQSFKPDARLKDDEISVIIVAADTKKARSIFTHVNRYAKPTSPGQNYITSDDDILAVVSRKIANKISARLVEYKTSSLNFKDEHFTTLSTIYNCMLALARSMPEKEIETTRLPDKETIEIIENNAEKIWDILLSKISLFRDALEDKSKKGDAIRIKLREENLLARPVVQECVFKAFLKLTSAPTNLSYEEAVEKLNELPWDLTNENIQEYWKNILWAGSKENGKMITKYRNLVTDIIFYLAGGNISDDDKERLLRRYKEHFTEEDKPETLPHLN